MLDMQDPTFQGAQGHMPLDLALGRKIFPDYGPKIVCALTRKLVFDHYFLSKKILGP